MDEVQLAAEQRARVLIDRQLAAAGWDVQHKKDLNLYVGRGRRSLAEQRFDRSLIRSRRREPHAVSLDLLP